MQRGRGGPRGGGGGRPECERGRDPPVAAHRSAAQRLLKAAAVTAAGVGWGQLRERQRWRLWGTAAAVAAAALLGSPPSTYLRCHSLPCWSSTHLVITGPLEWPTRNTRRPVLQGGGGSRHRQGGGGAALISPTDALGAQSCRGVGCGQRPVRASHLECQQTSTGPCSRALHQGRAVPPGPVRGVGEEHHLAYVSSTIWTRRCTKRGPARGVGRLTWRTCPPPS